MFTLTAVSSHLQDHVYQLHDRCKEDGDFEQVAVDVTFGICCVWKEKETVSLHNRYKSILCKEDGFYGLNNGNGC